MREPGCRVIRATLHISDAQIKAKLRQQGVEPDERTVKALKHILRAHASAAALDALASDAALDMLNGMDWPTRLTAWGVPFKPMKE